VHAARNTKPTLVETPLGNLKGKTSEDVTKIAVDILDYLRYVDVEETFHTLSDIYKGEKNDKIRKHIISSVERLARYDLLVWRKAGPYVQTVLATELERVLEPDRPLLRPILLAAWRELLKADMEGTSFSPDAVTITKAAVPVTEDIKRIREKAIDGLIALFDHASSEADKREVLYELREATRLPAQGNYSNELSQLVLQNTITIVELLTQRRQRTGHVCL
jgi:hypothetical protein